MVDFLLDLAGYTADANLLDAIAVEPSAGDGAFLVRMAERLVASCRRQNRSLQECRRSLIAYELDDRSAKAAKQAVVSALTAISVPSDCAAMLAFEWVRTGDYLFEAFRLPKANFVIGNPPYVRLEDIPEEVAGLYRRSYPTMTGRADLYVAFFEAGLSQLREGGVCAYICADRWMLNQYGTQLRSLITSTFGVETVVEMRDADAFENEVSAYPAITVMRRGPQGATVVASALPEAAQATGSSLANALTGVRAGVPDCGIRGLNSAVVNTWFQNSDPWPCSSPGRLSLLRRLEDRFEPLESKGNAIKVGIGVATGLDDVFSQKIETW